MLVMRAYSLLSALGRRIVLDLLRWEIEGLDNLPAEGPAILASNHVSYLDPPLIGALVKRPVYFMAKDEVFQVPLLGSFLRSIGTFPVRRGRPDVRAVRHALRILERGEILGIFPEGTRNRTGDLRAVQPFRAGIGWLAIRSRAPVIPIAIDGYVPWSGRPDWTRPTRMRLTFGEPLTFAGLYPHAGRGPRAEVAARVREAVCRLLSSGVEVCGVPVEAEGPGA